MLLFEEAKLKNIVLPNKPTNTIGTTFEGAIRDYSQTGALYNLAKLDLTSAYPSMVVNFCLDTQNILLKEEVCSCGSGGISSGINCIRCNKLRHKDAKAYSNGVYKGSVEINGIQFKQDENALLPSLITKLLKLKDTLKKEVKKHNPNTEEYDKAQTKYDAIKGVVNSAFGVMGYGGFTEYRVANLAG